MTMATVKHQICEMLVSTHNAIVPEYGVEEIAA